MDHRPPVLAAMRRELLPLLFSDQATARLHRLVDIDATLVAEDFEEAGARTALSRAEVLLTGWDCPPIDARVLAGAPRLRAVVHTGGSVKHHLTPACWQRGIQVASAVAANAVPVAEYTVAALIMANKRAWPVQRHYTRDRDSLDWLAWTTRYPEMGNYRRTVGVVGCSQVGRQVIRLLAGLDVTTVVYDPYLPADEAARLGVRLTGLDELMAVSDAVTLHAPATGETHRMIDRRRLALMRDGSTLINTARGSLVDTDALVRELSTGRLWAVLDVTDPDPLPSASPLFDLPNVLLTPHIAGSLGGELHRLGDSALDELERYTHGLPFACPVLAEHLANSA